MLYHIRRFLVEFDLLCTVVVFSRLSYSLRVIKKNASNVRWM